MVRLRQQYPQNYGSSGNINTEFENLTRYLNSAELGDNTIGELLAKIFDTAGNWTGPVEMRLDSSAGLQYRVGSYTDNNTGWLTLATLSSIKGADGSTAGTVGAPIFHSRQDTVTANNSTTVIDYAHNSTDELVVYVNGVLKRSGGSFDYTSSPTAGTGSAGAVTFNSALANAATVSIYKVRSTAITGFTRSDTVTTGAQNVFNFTHTEDQTLQVYKNGILQREGGSNDYTTQPDNNTVTFGSSIASGNTVTIITVQNTAENAVTGLLMEATYADIATGLLRFDKIGIADGAIAQAKVSGLSTGLAAKAKLTVASSTPSSPATGDLFLDTSQTPNVLKFYDGTQFLQTSPESSLPTFATADAGKFVKVNGTGTALQYGTIDLSSVIAVTQKGAANGVATLDSTGRLPSTQLPTSLSTTSFYFHSTTPSNATVVVKRIFKEKIQINGLNVFTASGTLSLQLAVNGVGQGTTYSVTSTPQDITLSTAIEVDATSASKSIGFIVTNNSSGSNLELTIAASVVST